MMATQGALAHLFDVQRDPAKRHTCTPRKGSPCRCNRISC